MCQSCVILKKKIFQRRMFGFGFVSLEVNPFSVENIKWEKKGRGASETDNVQGKEDNENDENEDLRKQVAQVYRKR